MTGFLINPYRFATVSLFYDENFEGCGTDSCDGSWSSTDLAKYDIDISANTLRCLVRGDSAFEGISTSLPSAVSDTAWVLRMKYVISNLVASNSVNDFGGITLSDSDKSVGWDTLSQKTLGFGSVMDSDGAGKSYYVLEWDGTTLGQTIFSRTPSAETLYIEMIRASATSFSVELFSDVDFTTSLEKKTRTIDSGITGLNKIKAFQDNRNTPNRHDINVHYFQIKNGVTLW